MYVTALKEKERTAVEEHVEVYVSRGRHGPRVAVVCAECGHAYSGGMSPNSSGFKTSLTYLKKHLEDKHGVGWEAAFDAKYGARKLAHRGYEPLYRAHEEERRLNWLDHKLDKDNWREHELTGNAEHFEGYPQQLVRKASLADDEDEARRLLELARTEQVERVLDDPEARLEDE